MPPAYRTHGAPSAPLAWRTKGCAIGDSGRAPERRRSLSLAPKRRERSSRTPRAAPSKTVAPLERWVAARAAPSCEPGQSSHAAVRGARRGASAERGWRPRRRARHRCEGNRPPRRHMNMHMNMNTNTNTNMNMHNMHAHDMWHMHMSMYRTCTCACACTCLVTGAYAYACGCACACNVHVDVDVHLDVSWMAAHRACECRGGGQAAQRAQQLLEPAELRP